MPKHLASVDLRPNGEYFITTYSFDGRLAIADGPPIVLARDASVGQLGTEAVAALLRSSTIVNPLTTGGKPASRDLLLRAGVKNYAAYAKGTRSVQLFADFDGESPLDLRIVPLDNQGTRGGYVSMGEKSVTVPYSANEAIGALVKTALELATT